MKKKSLIKRVMLIALAAVMLCMALAACSAEPFKCGMCNKEKTGKQHKYEFIGQQMIICDDCYKSVKGIGDAFGIK